MKPLPNQFLATGSHPRRPRGTGEGEREVGSGGVHFLGPDCGSGLSSSFFNDQFLVLEKKKKAKEREFEIYRKQYQCFVSVVFRLPHVRILPRVGSLLQPLIPLLTPSFCSSHESRQCRVLVPGGHHWKPLNFSTYSAPFLVLSYPSFPSPPTYHSLGPQAPLWTVCWGRGLLGSWGQRQEAEPRALVRFLWCTSTAGTRCCGWNWEDPPFNGVVATIPLSCCASQKKYTGSGLEWAWEMAGSRAQV